MRRACWIAIALTAGLAPQLAAEAPRPPGADGPAPIATRQNVFAIPFRVDNNGSGKQAAEVQLHVSTDAGASWQLAGKVAPTAGRFKFTAPHDGQYWFMVRTLDQQGVLRPAGPPMAELKVIVDTTTPVLELKAQRGNAGELRAQWRIRDDFLRAESLKISYRGTSSNSDPWQPVATDPLKREPGTGTLVGEATWWPNTSAACVMIRAEVTDLAGNSAASQARLDSASAVAGAPRGSAPPGAAPPPKIMPLPPTEDAGPAAAAGMRPLPSVADSPAAEVRPFSDIPAMPAKPKVKEPEAAVSWAPQKMAEPLVQAEAATPPPSMPSSFPNSAPPAEQLPVPQAARPADAPTVPVASKPMTRLAGRVATPPEAVLPPPAVPLEEPLQGPKPLAKAEPKPPAVPPLEPEQEPKLTPPARESRSDPATTDPLPAGLPAAGPALGGEQETAAVPVPSLPPGVRPRMVNTRRFELGYDVDSVGSDGVSKVELWGTRDGGRTWQCFGVDSDTRSPYPVRVDGEGLYGFRMIVETTSGLRGITPRAGDLPEIWVGVDTSKPVARLLATEPRPATKTTEVLVRWKADDRLLAARPITLLFSPEAAGPWTVLASGLENTGEYHWRIDARIPDRIFIRLEVRDEAGNLCAVESPEPITIDRIRPQGRILDVRPIGEARQRPANLR